MRKRIQELRKFFVYDKAHHLYRQKPFDPMLLAAEFQRNNIPDTDRAVIRLKYMLDNEKTIVFENEKIALMRTIPSPPELFTEEEMKRIKSSFRIHERGEVCNINVDYSMLLDKGFNANARK